MTTIDRFAGKHQFLSNFYTSDVRLDGKTYRTVEHAFQAAKTLDPLERELIRLANTPAKAKFLGRQAELREDWEQIKEQVMEDLLRQKFSHGKLKARLKETGTAELVEGNTWEDREWGVCGGKGNNKLGKLLMKIRREL